MLFLASCSPGFLSAAAPEVGALAPEFSLQGLDGEAVRLSQFRGRVVLLNFWATWCGPCRLEMPAIQDRYNDGGFEVLAINFDETAAQIVPFVAELGLTFPVLLDPGGRVQELYRIRGYPTSFLVDANGIIRFFHIGEMTPEILDHYLAQLGVAP
jgi:peroxiredoxin